MKTLIIMRGAPGCGKSTFLKENNLLPYVLSPDQIRIQCGGLVLNNSGNFVIPQKNDKAVWELFYQMLDLRLQQGSLVIIDATNTKTKDFTNYQRLCEQYKYRIYCLDMSDVPLDVCKSRNLNRETYKRVPSDIIEKMYERCCTQKIPSGITVLPATKESLNLIMNYEPLNFDHYKNIYIVGDIHGCMQPFTDFMNQTGNFNDNLYIFCGDYLDRGPYSAEVLNNLYALKDYSNVILLEGNHDRNLYFWGNNRIDDIKSKEFLEFTMSQLEGNTCFSKKHARELYRKLSQCVYFTYNYNEYFVCHGGISNIPEHLTTIPTEQLIRGVGQYSEYSDVAEAFQRNTGCNTYLVNGHRNVESLNIHANDRCYNLEGKVEFGGNLRAIKISHNGITSIEVPNDDIVPRHLTTKKNKFAKYINIDSCSVDQAVEYFRENHYIKEKKFGDISSFNFTRDAFNKKIWDQQTIKSRGLYIDTKNNKVVCRGYDKFFKVEENELTSLSTLKSTLKFPVTVYQKENGYLGLISYNYNTDQLFFTTKSDPFGDYAINFKNIFPENGTNILKEYLKKNNCTLAVEVIDPVFDPHIIQYKDKAIIGLDIIDNNLCFSKKSYEDLKDLCNKIGIQVKEEITVLNNWEEFMFFYKAAPIQDEANSSQRKHIEGWVLEDSECFMIKIKSKYYDIWKRLRGITYGVIKTGNRPNMDNVEDPISRIYVQWLMIHAKDYSSSEVNIIKLRHDFLKESSDFFTQI